MELGNTIYILYGLSVPVILRKEITEKDREKTMHASLIGECYVHGYMDGEAFMGISEKGLQEKTIKFELK
jgi:hypothetical protein